MKKLILIIPLLLFGCAHKQIIKPNEPIKIIESEYGKERAKLPVNVDFVEQGDQEIYFDFDSDVIKEQIYLYPYSNKSIVITGYCDERGTEEYNYKLGLRRAEAVKEYIKEITQCDIEVVSKGKGMAGKGKEHWDKDRKVVIEYKKEGK